jgi:hypothetical protein
MIKAIDSPLYVVSVVSNPVRYLSRYRLYRQFEKHVIDAGATLVTVELALGERPFEVTEAGNPRHVQLRSPHELWHKENMINIGISRLPADWKYVAWVDADIQFTRTDWVEETVQQLQHYSVVQMWSHAQDLGPHHEPINTHYGFAYCHNSGVSWSRMSSGCYAPQGASRAYYWHPGYAWAARREAINATGGLIDWAILGAADMHMAKCLIGRATEETAPGIHPNYTKRLQAWQDAAVGQLRHNLGHVPGLINHYWHGKKANRKYWDRWKILVENQYDPEIDIKRDWQGVLQLVDHGTERSIGLRDGIRGYFRSRDEDSIDL